MLSNEEIFSWVELRLSRFYWLDHMDDVIKKVKRINLDDKELYDFFLNHFVGLSDFERKLAGSACIADCKAMCCYFPKDYSSNVPITVYELERLGRILSKNNLRCGDYYTMVPYSMINPILGDYLASMPDFFFDVDGVKMVCMLNLSNRTIDRKLLEHMPKPLVKFRSVWVDDKSYACKFLDKEGKCVLYKRLRFLICMRFFCLTAIAIAILKHLGFADESMLKLPMKELNDVANDVSIAFRGHRLVEWESEYDSMFRELVIAYVKDKGKVREKYNRLKEFEREYGKVIGDCIKRAVKNY